MSTSPAPAQRSRENALLLMRIACLVALAACTALAIDYRGIESSFCGAESGCGAVRATDFAYLWGLGPTLPELGLAAFALVFVATLSRAVRLAAVLAAAGAIVGLLLLAAQAFALRSFCWLCVIVDSSAIVAGVGAVLLFHAERGVARTTAAPERLRLGAWLVLFVLAVAGPGLWPWLKPSPPVPDSIRAYYQSGKINVVEFADFECPFCRRLHYTLKELLAPYGERVNFVRLNMPLPRHPQARDAALAAICAEPSGKADALAEFMFSSDDLSREAIRDRAEKLGVDPSAFARCLEAPATRARLERESRILRDVGFQGLPTTYIGANRIVGAQSPETFQDALERAARGDLESGIPGWAYALFLAGCIGLVVYAGRVRPSRARA